MLSRTIGLEAIFIFIIKNISKYRCQVENTRNSRRIPDSSFDTIVRKVFNGILTNLLFG